MCFYGGHSTGYKLGNHPKNIEPCAHRATTPPIPEAIGLTRTIGQLAEHDLESPCIVCKSRDPSGACVAVFLCKGTFLTLPHSLSLRLLAGTPR